MPQLPRGSARHCCEQRHRVLGRGGTTAGSLRWANSSMPPRVRSPDPVRAAQLLRVPAGTARHVDDGGRAWRVISAEDKRSIGRLSDDGEVPLDHLELLDDGWKERLVHEFAQLEHETRLAEDSPEAFGSSFTLLGGGDPANRAQALARARAPSERTLPLLRSGRPTPPVLRGTSRTRPSADSPRNCPATASTRRRSLRPPSCRRATR
jgi:hypothetical protein